MNNFWYPENFNLNDDQINDEIWGKSRELQKKIQCPDKLIALGSVGAQQAMLDENQALGIKVDDVLPWVPDIVGKNSDKENGLLIFGAAYAGFIYEYSSRPACMPLCEYVKAVKDQDIAYFQKQFLDRVVAPDSSYYGKIKSLMQSVQIKSSQIVLSDLCPCSVVKRQIKNGQRKDDSKQPSKDRAKIFCEYVENPQVQKWTADRILKSKSRHIIALGHIAEHGLLRLFSRMGAKFYNGNQPFNLQTNIAPPWKWVDQYADHPNRNLKFWIDNNTWWTIRKGDRDWRLLPIYHPAIADRYDSNYNNTISLLKNFLSNNDAFENK
jgi:hypothetical protein